jgi:DNA-binding XRE family transcriptional regulator
MSKQEEERIMTTKLEKELHSAEQEWKLYLDKADIDPQDVERARTEWEYSRKMSRFSNITVGYRLKHERKLSGLTQEEVAKAMGIKTSTLSNWETGKHDITLKDAHRLMMLYRMFPGKRTYEQANLNDLTMTPMELFERLG